MHEHVTGYLLYHSSQKIFCSDFISVSYSPRQLEGTRWRQLQHRPVCDESVSSAEVDRKPWIIKLPLGHNRPFKPSLSSYSSINTIIQNTGNLHNKCFIHAQRPKPSTLSIYQTSSDKHFCSLRRSPFLFGIEFNVAATNQYAFTWLHSLTLCCPHSSTSISPSIHLLSFSSISRLLTLVFHVSLGLRWCHWGTHPLLLFNFSTLSIALLWD